MSRRLPVLVLALACLAVPASAPAAGIGAAAPAAAPAGSVEGKLPLVTHGPKKATVKIRVGHLDNGRAPIYSKVPVFGTLAPFARGQRVSVSYFLDGKKLTTKKVRVRKGSGNTGVFHSVIVLRKGGKYAASARHVANRKLGGDHTVRKSWKVSYRAISHGSCGRAVHGFRLALNKLGYVPGGGSCFNGKMGRAVLAFRKVNGMARTERAGKGVVRQVFSGRGGYHVHYPNAGEHVEAPLAKQVIVFSKGSDVFALYPISSGKPSTPTIQGHFNFYLSQPGYNSEGMYYSRYFHGGYAIHGYHSVPNYPASHGCLRTYISDQPEIYNRIFIGEDIFVF
ncbi:MAG TPA: L,D-transpeptidase [Myxococcaceae bacterium]|nr:L,D-transpeptidase [Myxococcaceae bacterium]